MPFKKTILSLGVISLSVFTISSCSTYSGAPERHQVTTDYASRLPGRIITTEKVVMVDPSVHAWGAYDTEGNLLRAGIATAGANYCPDTDRPCRTSVGHYRIFSLGNAACKSSKFPLPHGGAPMPYCMFFNGGQGLHGSGSREVIEANVSHGCVRMQIADAEWLRFNFASVGTKVIVKPY